jgi:hypothetical protein
MNKPFLPTLPTSPTLPTLPTLPTFQISLKHRTLEMIEFGTGIRMCLKLALRLKGIPVPKS